MYLQVIHYYDPERTETTAAYNTRVAGSGRADSKPVAEKWSKQSKPTNKTKKGGRVKGGGGGGSRARPLWPSFDVCYID